MLPVFFATNQLYDPPCSAEIQPMSQQDASATSPYRRLILDMRKNEKDEKFVHLQGSALTFSGVVGKEVTVCFLLG